MIKQARYARDSTPVDAECGCPVCHRFSRAYLRHLFLSHEMLGVRLNTLHNLWFYGSLMKEVRHAIKENRFEAYRQGFYRRRQDTTNEPFNPAVTD